MSQISRRTLLKGGTIAVAGASFASFSQLFGYKHVFAQGEGDDPQTILDLAATAETLACTHYYNVLTDSNIALTPAEIAILKSALDSELQHLEFLNANGAVALTMDFFFPMNVYTDRDQFSVITEQAETAFVGAYLAANRRIAELGNPLLAATTAQVAVVEQVHLALIRQIGGRVPNHVSLGQALFYNTSDVVPVLQGFLEGGEGFAADSSPFPGPDAIRDIVRDDGVMAVKPFVDPTLFGNTSDATADASSGACTISARANQMVNIRSEPSTNSTITGTISGADTAEADAQTTDVNSFVWLRLVNGGWVRSDVVISTGMCSALPPA
ncbi:MAG: ferritin-like domain-containing protein [Chitinophagaceae bacterium]|nr:ferritin-like domain-containing protein [Anaerolineae bacterium]